jgi:hypothetical protein
LADRSRLADFQRRRFGDIGAELRVKFGQVVRKYGGLVAGAGDSDVAETEIEQVRVNGSVGIDDDALSGESLRTVTGDSVTVIESKRPSNITF